MNKIVFKNTIGSYFAYCGQYPEIVVLGQFMDDEYPFSDSLLDFLKSDTQNSKGLNETHLIKYDNFVCILSQIFDEPDNRYDIHKDILIKILETFLDFDKGEPNQILLIEENGMYTMSCEGKTVQINDTPMPVTNPIKLTRVL